MDALIEALRQKQGNQTLDEFGRFLGVDHTTLSRIYNGERGIGIHTLRKIVAKYPDFVSFFVSDCSNNNQ